MDFTLESYHAMLERLQAGITTLDDVMLLQPANEFIADLNDRIAMQGLDSENSKIGDYSKKKMWAGKAAFTNQANFRPERKANGELRKTMTLEDGYFELRQLDGQRNDRVVLERTGAALKNIKTGVPENHEVAVGFTDDDEAVKLRGYEDRHRERTGREILAPTPDELERITAAQIREYKIFITEIFRT